MKHNPAKALLAAVGEARTTMSKRKDIRYACAVVTDGYCGHITAADSNADSVELAKMVAAFMVFVESEGAAYARRFFAEYAKRLKEQEEARS